MKIKKPIRKFLVIAAAVILFLMFFIRFFFVEVIDIPKGRCPRAGETVCVSRWSYGYRPQWNGNSRWLYIRARRNDWVAYNRPPAMRDALPDTSEVLVGRISAIPGDTLWYNNETGEVARKRSVSEGFSHKVLVPGRNKTMKVTRDNVGFYAQTIMNYEPVKASIVKDSLCVSGKTVKEYTFQQDYYWVVTDDDNNLIDSRTFGFVTHANLIGHINTSDIKKVSKKN